MKTIPLHGGLAAGRVALVDDDDYDMLARYRWFAFEKIQNGKPWGPYAVANDTAIGHGRRILMHKLITGFARTDHHDHDGLNNQRSNLRDGAGGRNNQNILQVTPHSSVFKGVCLNKRSGKWRAVIKSEGRQRSLGEYRDEVTAARAYDAAAAELFGEYACFNFPDEDHLMPLRDSRPLVHGTTRYSRYGCRCDICKASASAYKQVMKLRKLNAMKEAA